MTKSLNTQSEKRKQESLLSKFDKTEGQEVIFLKSSSDVGVMRNGGRNGAMFAPKALLSHIKRLTLDGNSSHFSFREVEVANMEEELLDFTSAQKKQSERISSVLKISPKSRAIHIGGGHDHIYPLLRHFMSKKRVIVLNIDAHADTRNDEEFHSGTPFRQFAEEYHGEFHLFQYGLHSFANSASTLIPLSRGKMEILWSSEIKNELKVTEFFEKIRALIDPETIVVFSLDADAMAGHLVPAVSAVNGTGLDYEDLMKAWEKYSSLPLPHPQIMGIYELNPVYDTISSVSMRFIGNFIFKTLKA